MKHLIKIITTSMFFHLALMFSSNAQNEIVLISKNTNYVFPYDTLQKGTEFEFKYTLFDSTYIPKGDTITLTVTHINGDPIVNKYINYENVEMPGLYDYSKVFSSNTRPNIFFKTTAIKGQFNIRVFTYRYTDYCNLSIKISSKLKNSTYLFNQKLNGCL